MVMQVFPTGGGFNAYREARRGRLQDESMRTEMDLRNQQREAFNRMLGGMPEDQRAAYEAMGAERGGAALIQGRQAEAESEAEAEMQRRQELTEYANNFATRIRELEGQEGFDRDEVLRQGYDYGREVYGMQAPFEEFARRVTNPAAGELPSAGRDVNYRQQTLSDPAGNLFEVITDPRAPTAEPIVRPMPGSPAQPMGPLTHPVQRSSVTTQDVSPVSTGDEDMDPEVFFMGSQLKSAYERAITASPQDFGTPGFLRGLAQDVGQQVLAMRGITFDQLRDVALAEADPNADEASLERIEAFFDPDIRGIERDFRLLAYQAASAIANQTGRGLSDRDLQQFRAILGNPNALLGNQPAYVDALRDLDGMVVRKINAHRRANGKSLIPEGVSFLDGSFERYAMNPEAFESEPQGSRAFQVESQQRGMPQRGDFDSTLDYLGALEEWQGGQ